VSLTRERHPYGRRNAEGGTGAADYPPSRAVPPRATASAHAIAGTVGVAAMRPPLAAYLRAITTSIAGRRLSTASNRHLELALNRRMKLRFD